MYKAVMFQRGIMLDSIQFTAPLPIVAALTAIGGAIYTVWKFRNVVKQINEVKGKAIHQAYNNYFRADSESYQPSYFPIDPDKEMERLSNSLIVKLYSRKNANLIYARITECIEKHRFLLNSSSIDESLTSNKHFNVNFLNNSILYFFLVDILQKSNSERIKEFKKFDEDNSYIYCRYDGYFKKFTTISYQPET